jgi:hypothetical protein
VIDSDEDFVKIEIRPRAVIKCRAGSLRGHSRSKRAFDPVEIARPFDVLPPQRAHAGECLAAATAENGDRDDRQRNHDREKKHFAVTLHDERVGATS